MAVQYNNKPKSETTSTNFFDIDQYRLDKEWLLQARLFYEHAMQLAEARAEYERAKARREIVAAEKDKDIRAHSENYKLEKITEGVVEKTIILSKKYQVANEAVINAKHNADIAQVAVDTLEHKKKALENMVQLDGRNYYSEPKTPKGMGREEADAIKKSGRNWRSKND